MEKNNKTLTSGATSIEVKNSEWYKKYEWYNYITYTNVDKKTGENKEKYLSRTTVDVLSWIVNSADIFNEEHTEIERKQGSNDKYHFYSSVEYIANSLKCSRFTVNNATNLLQNLGLLNKYRSINTTKWFVNYDKLYEFRQIYVKPSIQTEEVITGPDSAISVSSEDVAAGDQSYNEEEKDDSNIMEKFSKEEENEITAIEESAPVINVSSENVATGTQSPKEEPNESICKMHRKIKNLSYEEKYSNVDRKEYEENTVIPVHLEKKYYIIDEKTKKRIKIKYIEDRKYTKFINYNNGKSIAKDIIKKKFTIEGIDKVFNVVHGLNFKKPESIVKYMMYTFNNQILNDIYNIHNIEKTDIVKNKFNDMVKNISYNRFEYTKFVDFVKPLFDYEVYKHIIDVNEFMNNYFDCFLIFEGGKSGIFPNFNLRLSNKTDMICEYNRLKELYQPDDDPDGGNNKPSFNDDDYDDEVEVTESEPAITVSSEDVAAGTQSYKEEEKEDSNIMEKFSKEEQNEVPAIEESAPVEEPIESIPSSIEEQNEVPGPIEVTESEPAISVSSEDVAAGIINENVIEEPNEPVPVKKNSKNILINKVRDQIDSELSKITYRLIEDKTKFNGLLHIYKGQLDLLFRNLKRCKTQSDVLHKLTLTSYVSGPMLKADPIIMEWRISNVCKRLYDNGLLPNYDEITFNHFYNEPNYVRDEFDYIDMNDWYKNYKQYVFDDPDNDPDGDNKQSFNDDVIESISEPAISVSSEDVAAGIQSCKEEEPIPGPIEEPKETVPSSNTDNIEDSVKIQQTDIDYAERLKKVRKELWDETLKTNNSMYGSNKELYDLLMKHTINIYKYIFKNLNTFENKKDTFLTLANIELNGEILNFDKNYNMGRYNINCFFYNVMNKLIDNNLLPNWNDGSFPYIT
jgi:Mn-dependent DtxR family transcriptional regulator